MTYPLTLALDCSLGGFALAVGGGTLTVPRMHVDNLPKASDTLHVVLQRFLADERKAVANIARVVATVGPGSFTGIRMGLAVGEALKLLRPTVALVGVSTFQALACQIVADARPASSFTVVLDAAGGMAYVQTFEVDGCAQSEAQCVPLANVVGNAGHVFAPPLLVPSAMPLPPFNPAALLTMNDSLHVPFAPCYIKPLTYKASA